MPIHKLVLQTGEREIHVRQNQQNQQDLLEKLQRELMTEKYDCMICFEKVYKRQATFSCPTCFAVFHLKCINTWAAKSQGQGWRCPGCQTVSIDKPLYYCFCSKKIQPDFNRLICPHSCGDTCSKDRGCLHKCPIPCHPGPCPPCNLFATPISCACGKGLLKVTCQQKLELDFVPSCGATCEKLLKCGKHQCSLSCHGQPCPSCSIKTIQKCFCGQNEKSVSCGSEGGYSCKQQCPFTFDCGHQCLEDCHEHQHDSKCPLDPSNASTCPCGKMAVKRQNCNESIPLCNSKCGKKRDCGHVCSIGCHYGDCRPCEVMVETSCRCGKSSRVEMKCHLLQSDGTSNPLCSRVCSAKLPCGRHKCDEICCMLKGEHKCNRICGKTLSCTKHQCMMSCGHDGNCHDCVEGATFDELSCACGKTFMYPPIPCNTPPPKCNYACKKRKPCGHRSHTSHYCHPESDPCPPCTIFTERQCACGDKMMKNIPCSRQTKPSCGTMCKKTIPECGHDCGRVCHDGNCLDTAHPCTKRCGTERSCGHVCQYPCHGVLGCPETLVCKQMVLFTCPCGHLKIKKQCGVGAQVKGDEFSLECNETCAKQQRAEKMAIALKIDGDNIGKLGPFIGWEEKVVKLGITYPSIVLDTEKKLQQLVADSKTQYYYFPEQKMLKVNNLIAHMATTYGFLAEVVDERLGKPNVIVRRQKNHAPSVPSQLLSLVCKQYNPMNPLSNKYIINQDYENRKVLPNGLYLIGIAPQVTAGMLWICINEVLVPLVDSASLYWMDDDQCFIYFRRKEVETDQMVPEPENQTETEDVVFVEPNESNNEPDEFELVDGDTLESVTTSIPEPTLPELCKEKLGDLVTNVFEITISPVGGIHFEDGKISHYKRRNTSSFRFSNEEVGWKKAAKSWKDDGLVLIK